MLGVGLGWLPSLIVAFVTSAIVRFLWGPALAVVALGLLAFLMR